MAQRHSEYERLYNVGLLDDLHNYFPDLLYNSGQFQSVQDVLTYIRATTQHRFDLYSFGLRDYQSQRTQTPPSQEERVQTPPRAPRIRVRTTSRTVPAGEPAAASTNPLENRIPPASLPRRGTVATNEIEEDDPELIAALHEMVNFMAPAPRQPRRMNSAISLFTNLFGGGAAAPLVNQTLGGFDILTAQAQTRFMEPVAVRPTAEQIERGSRVDVLAVASSDNCAICQDSFAAHANRRTLTVCGHAFHMNCIDTWFEQNVHCPVCRHDIRDTSVD